MNPRESLLENFLDDFSTDQMSSLDMSSHSIHGTPQQQNAISVIPEIGSTISGATELELKAIADRLLKVYKESGFSHLLRNVKVLEASAKTNSSIEDDVTVCYREVPSMFFRSDFSLRNPDTFNQILGPGNTKPGKPGLQPPTSRQAKDGQNKQETLSRYLDLVEVALLKQIYVKSTAFFTALDDIKGLQLLVADASSKLMALRKSLRSADDGIAMSAMRIPQLYRRRMNEKALGAHLRYTQQVVMGKKAIEELLSMDDYVGALEVVSATRKIYAEHLTPILALRSVGSQLEEYSGMICDIMCNKFVNACVSWAVDADADADQLDMYMYDQATGAATTMSVSSSSSSGSSFTTPSSKQTNGTTSAGADQREHHHHHHHHHPQSSSSDSLHESNLGQLVLSLISVGKLQSALLLYKSRLSDAVRLIVRTCVLEFLSTFDPTAVVELLDDTNSGPEADTPFATRVRGMTSDNFLACLSMCFENLLQALQRCESVYNFISSFIEGKFVHSSSKSEVEATTATEIASDAVIDGQSGNDNDRIGSGNAIAVNLTAIGSEDQDVILSLNKSCKTSCCELAQRSLSQLISLRKDANSKLAVDKMKYLWEISLNFVSSM